MQLLSSVSIDHSTTCNTIYVYFVVYFVELIFFVLYSSGQPVPIEYLPAEHTLDSRVRLVIKYQV